MMTEYTDKVQDQDLKNRAEKWGKEVKFIHYNDGIEETKFNSGKSRFIDRNTGKEWTVFPDDAKLSLVDRFSKWLVDRREI
tara:strand:+ start:208 stop:450 length:243 start_codon:yes stop_codon:yes gene_type:complete